MMALAALSVPEHRDEYGAAPAAGAAHREGDS